MDLAIGVFTELDVLEFIKKCVWEQILWMHMRTLQFIELRI